jgi:hypothetical protein
MAWKRESHIDLRSWKVGVSIGWFGERHRDPSPPWQPEGPSNGQLLMAPARPSGAAGRICAYGYMLTAGTPSM